MNVWKKSDVRNGTTEGTGTYTNSDIAALRGHQVVVLHK